jgi:ATP-dependent DNA helicase RecG
MNDAELLELLNNIESDRVERKAALSDPDKVRQAICAFANDLPNHRKPGVLFIGVNDNGTCAGTAITDKMLVNLAGMRDDGNISPFPSLIVQRKTLAGCDMAVVIVEPSDAPPVRFQGRVWIRVGPRRAVATPEDELRLTEKRRAKARTFDATPIWDASLADLDLDMFEHDYLPNAVAPEIIQQNNRSIEDKLSSLRFITPDHVPTVMGVLTIGKDPRRFIPGAYIQFVRFSGLELTDPIRHQTELGGPFVNQMRQLDELLKANISVALDYTSAAQQIQRPDIPPVALQQMTRNAVMHRTYEASNAPVHVYWFEDRVEIQNPGGPYGQVNQENFGMTGIVDYRNPLVAEVLKNLGYVQRFGVGISSARKALSDNGNPPLEFVVNESNVLAILRRQV